MNTLIREADSTLQALINSVRQGDSTAAQLHLRECLRVNSVNENMSAPSPVAQPFTTSNLTFSASSRRDAAASSHSSPTLMGNAHAAVGNNSRMGISYSGVDSSRPLGGFGSVGVGPILQLAGRKSSKKSPYSPRPLTKETWFRLNLTLVDGPEDDFAMIVSTFVRFEKSWDATEVKNIITQTFNDHLRGTEFGIKVAAWGGRGNANGIGSLRFVDDMMPIPDADLLFRQKSLRTVYVVPVQQITENEDEEEPVAPRTYRPSQRISTNMESPPPTAQSLESFQLVENVQEPNSHAISSPLSASATDDNFHLSRIVNNEYAETSSTNSDYIGGLERSADLEYLNYTPARSASAEQVYKNYMRSLKVEGTQSIRVKRESLLHDSIVTLSSPDFDPYMEPRVIFTSEQGIDAGGLKRQWFWEVGHKLFTEIYASHPLFDGECNHKLPSAGHPLNDTVFAAIANFIICSAIHGPYGLKGLSEAVVNFFTHDTPLESIDANTNIKDLSYDIRAAVNECSSPEAFRQITNMAFLQLRNIAKLSGFQGSINMSTLTTVRKCIISYDIYKKRLQPLEILKQKLEACGMNEFLRNNSQCCALLFPKVESIPVPVSYLLRLLETSSSETESEAYGIELNAKNIIAEYLRHVEGNTLKITDFLVAVTGTGEPPTSSRKIKIVASEALYFSTCSYEIKVPRAFNSHMLVDCIEGSGELGYTFDRH